jgi:16S rRNA (cytosine967-C5)-methyltransferase
MSLRSQSYFNKTVSLIQQYKGVMPLASYLRQYFALNKKHGSKDRKFISHLCYCFYRLGGSLNEMEVEERLKIAVFLCNDEAGDWDSLFDELWLINWDKDINKRIEFIQSVPVRFSVEDIFPWKDELSEGIIDPMAFSLSHLRQPDLFLRIRPGKEKPVMEKLSASDIPFHAVNSSCLVLPNASKVDTILKVDEEVVIQDYSSQRIADFLLTLLPDIGNTGAKVWDACAASGGKSILATDLLPKIQLTVSDVRLSILQNLKKRFERAGIKQYKSFVTDLTTNPKVPDSGFQLIICDAPCSGSGTWGRSPEHSYFFSPEKIDHYAELQKRIVDNAVPHLANKGYFLYITCSVFKKENEEVVRYLQQQFPFLQLKKQEMLNGYEHKADSLFAALFQKTE